MGVRGVCVRMFFHVGWWWRRGAVVTWSVMRAVCTLWGFGARRCWMAAQGLASGGGVLGVPKAGGPAPAVDPPIAPSPWRAESRQVGGWWQSTTKAGGSRRR
jgi:hypothetical protein